MRPILLTASLPLLVACYPRGLQAPIPYSVSANGGLESMRCAQDKLVELEFEFGGDQREGTDLVGTRSSRRSANQLTGAIRDIAHEVVRLEQKGEGGRAIFEMTIGIARRPDPTVPDSPRDRSYDVWLEAPPRSSIREVDEIARDCQGPPFG